MVQGNLVLFCRSTALFEHRKSQFAKGFGGCFPGIAETSKSKFLSPTHPPTHPPKFGKWLGPLQEGFAKNAFSYLMTLRLIPLFPFFVVNLVSGLTRMNVGSYVAATALGIIPGSFVYAYAGRQLGTINSLKEIASPNVIAAFVLLGLLALVPIVDKKFTAKQA